MSGSRVVASAAEMVNLVELTGIKVYDIAGHLVEPPALEASTTDDPDRQPEPRTPGESFAVFARGGDTWFETRTKLVVQTVEADLSADAGAIFTYSEPLTVSREVAGEFVEKVGVMAVYPFVREQVFTTASRLGVAPPVMGLLRAGQFRIELPTEDHVANPDGHA